jgi:hypothetical protein
MDNTKICIDIRIEASSEDGARCYAARQGFDMVGATWSKNHHSDSDSNSDSGRLYIVCTSQASMPNDLLAIQCALASSR